MALNSRVEEYSARSWILNDDSWWWPSIGFPSFHHSMVNGGSPFITVHVMDNLWPTWIPLGSWNGSIFGATWEWNNKFYKSIPGERIDLLLIDYLQILKRAAKKSGPHCGRSSIMFSLSRLIIWRGSFYYFHASAFHNTAMIIIILKWNWTDHRKVIFCPYY